MPVPPAYADVVVVEAESPGVRVAEIRCPGCQGADVVVDSSMTTLPRDGALTTVRRVSTLGYRCVDCDARWAGQDIEI